MVAGCSAHRRGGDELTVAPTGSSIDVRTELSVREFRAVYENRCPVIMRSAARFPAVETWTLDSFGRIAPNVMVQVKTGNVAQGNTARMTMAEYCRILVEWQHRPPAEHGNPPPYLHDVPLLAMIPELRRDLEPFPVELFPSFYRRRWWMFAQVFVGPGGAQTPLHFDTLLTHNLFFQVLGRKRWVLVHPDDLDRTYAYNWRWSPVDPEAPDLERFPRFAAARVSTCTVEGGDILYLPPGTLHKVVSETGCISFNLDWHDWRSALRGVAAVRRGMPLRNLRYNALIGLGVWARLPLPVLLPGLRSYFTYVS
jgi:ribosomal protein L16 Arg81 hydroxylase